jgi:hypothetical protein
MHHQDPDPDDYEDEDLDRYHDDFHEEDLEELGTPVYQGSGLSVRALTAEELQRFPDAHADQPAALPGSGWAALDPPGHPLGVPGPLQPPRCQWCRPSHPAAAWAAPAARPWPPTGGAAPPSWPRGPAVWPGGCR